MAAAAAPGERVSTTSSWLAGCTLERAVKAELR